MKDFFIAAGLILALLFAAPGLVLAEETESSREETEGQGTDEVVVTATRIETYSKEVGSSITVISGKEIEESQNTAVLELLRTVSSLDVAQSGGTGGATSIFIRGANSEHTLVLVDGVEMNDPISTGRSYNFANLTVDNIERIEVLRGPQSTLYGSDAIGGVINIITKKGKGKPSFFISGEGGSFNTFKESIGVSGGSGQLSYSLGISRLDSDGISSANEKDGNTEKDGYENTSVSARLGLRPSEDLDLDLTLRYITAKADIDNSGGVGGDDPNNTIDSKQLFFKTQARLSLFDDIWEQRLGVSVSDHERENNNDNDIDHPDDLVRSTFDSRLVKFDWQHNLYLNKANTLTIGVETEEEKGKSNYYSESSGGPFSSILKEKTARTTGYYLQDRIKLGDGFFTTLGLRFDDHTRFGSKSTYRIASTYLIKQTGSRIKGSYGTGFKAPSLYQLYSQYGDLNLDPEESKGWDIGIEQSLFGERLTLGVTYFNNEFDNMIEYDGVTSKYKNVARAASQGVEAFVSVAPTVNLTVKASYVYTETEDKTTGKALLRRAKNKFGLDLGYDFLEKGNLNLAVAYVGARDDNDYSTWPSRRVVLESYTLVNLAASFNITENLELFARADNLFDEEYEEVRGYGTPGFALYGGLKMTF